MIKSIIRVVIIVALILLVPLIAMQFTKEVDWDLGDFVVMGALLFITGMGIEFSLKKLANPAHKVVVSLVIVLGFLLIWAELAVGIVGTPFAGS
jgi:hypothetical protein